jgi:hypothetical protein
MIGLPMQIVVLAALVLWLSSPLWFAGRIRR